MLLQPGDAAQRRALAAAGRTEQREELALLDLEGYVVDSVDQRAFGLEDLLEIGDDERAHGMPQLFPSREMSHLSRRVIGSRMRTSMVP
jgi:hypothetical protein